MVKNIFDMIKALEVKKEEFVYILPVGKRKSKFVFIRLGEKGKLGSIIEIVTSVSRDALNEVVERLPSIYDDTEDT